MQDIVRMPFNFPQLKHTFMFYILFDPMFMVCIHLTEFVVFFSFSVYKGFPQTVNCLLL